MSLSRRHILLAAGLALAATTLSGCGFKPLYGKGSSDVVPQFSQIIVAQPEDRSSQQLRNYLLDSLTPRGEPDRPRYILDYRLTESVGAVFVTRSEEITRNNLQMNVAATLRDYETGQAIFSISTNSQASYNLTLADYSNLVSEKNARERALKDLSEQIRLRLGNFFDRPQQRQSQRQ